MLGRLIATLTNLFTGRTASTQASLPPNQLGAFALTEIESRNTPKGVLKTWRAASRRSEAPPFAFRLEILLKTPKGESPLAFSGGAIIREDGADGRQFLDDVARAIESDADAPAEAEAVERLDFSLAILGTSLSRQPGENLIGGVFTSSRSGNWIACKLFLADIGEVYLNLDPVGGEGEFTTKDPGYGEIVLQELAKVFLPR